MDEMVDDASESAVGKRRVLTGAVREAWERVSAMAQVTYTSAP